jgi:hypothetical protein
LPRKSDPEYASAVVHLLQKARELDGGQPIKTCF